MSFVESQKYSTTRQSADKAATHLALDANSVYPQARPIPSWLIAEFLIQNIGEPGQLTITEAYEANIDPEIAWEDTRNNHAAYGIGTDRKAFRNPDNPDSPEIHPINKDWLANFVKGFISDAILVIVTGMEHFTGEESIKNLEVSEIQKILEENVNLRNEVLRKIRAVTQNTEELGKERRESYKQEMEQKYGPGGVRYNR